MNTRGEHRAEPGTRSRTPRTAVLLLALAVAAGGAIWGEVHYARAGQTSRAGSGSAAVSQESTQSDGGSSDGVVSDIAALHLNDVLPQTVVEQPTPTSPDGYQATRYGGSSSDDCDEAFTISAPAAVSARCGGYLTADYVEQDRSVYTCVTVFLYSDPTAAARVASALNSPAAVGAVTFLQPASGLPDAILPSTLPSAGASTPPGAQDASADNPAGADPGTRIEAVGSTVDVVQSVAADGQPVPGQLDTPTWYLAYTVGAKLAWQ